MYRWGLPLACLFFTVALATGIFTIRWLVGTWLWVGAGLAAVCFYAAVMCVHLFELSSCPVVEPQAPHDSRGWK
jgi:hypothetical protein